MDTNWLEDFVVLAETRSFSRAAQMRHITQPAFSRRIQALEAWLGFDLINRATYPASLTPAGETFYSHAQELLGRIGTLRNSAAPSSADADDRVSFALPHTLSLTYFPQWLSQWQQSLGPLVSRARVGNVLDVVLWLVEGSCDVLLCYHHPQQPVQLDAERYDVLALAVEGLAPYARRGADRKSAFDWPGRSQRPVPYLAYTPNAYLAQMADIAITAGRSRPFLRRVFETDMAETLRQMVLAGHGVAFLPDSIAAADLAAGHLARLDGGWEVQLQIRAYRERPTLARPARPRVEQLWRSIEARAAGKARAAGTVPLNGVEHRKHATLAVTRTSARSAGRVTADRSTTARRSAR
jgi:DNA-binding transcriptional LysR family regulator